MATADRNIASKKIEFGDWQTNYELAAEVCNLLKSKGINPQIIIEPTCGVGNFILAALDTFENLEGVYGIEIQKSYLEALSSALKSRNSSNVDIKLINANVFEVDLSDIIDSIKGKNILVLGNPPWITNSKLGRIEGQNLPIKNNCKRLKGIDAITGKGGFDIAEAVCYKFMNELNEENISFALLLKNSVVKNIVHEQHSNRANRLTINQYNIDAKKEFGATVDACLMFAEKKRSYSEQCQIFDFYSQNEICKYGWINDKFVSNVNKYNDKIDGHSQLQWWSGIKHDCSKVMELTKVGDVYVNGFGDIVDIEDDIIFPLLKSSDINGEVITNTTHFVIVPQSHTSQDTSGLKDTLPKAYNYLLQHADQLDARKSVIYERRPRFSIFGIGDYSFKSYKVVVSGLYKHAKFSLVGLIEGKPVMLDDTCYMVGFDDAVTAKVVFRTLNDDCVRSFLHSLIFFDAKRIINKELLMRINLDSALNIVCQKYNLNKPQLITTNNKTQQLSLF